METRLVGVGRLPGGDADVAERSMSPVSVSARVATAGTAGYGTLMLVASTSLAFVTAITMVGPFLLDISRELDVPLGTAGLLATITAVPWSLGAPFTGLLSDRFGRRPMIVLALGGMGLASLAVPLVPDFRTLMALRFLTGLCGAFGPASLMASVGDLFPAQRRGMAMSWLNLGFGLAAVGGVPAVGVVGGVFGWRVAFATVGAVLVGMALLLRLMFPAPPPAGLGSSLRATYGAVFSVPRLFNVLGANLLERALFNGAALYVPSFLMLSYHLSVTEVAPALALVALGAIAGTAVGGWAGDRFPKARTFVVAQLAAAAMVALLFWLPAGLVLSVALGVLFGLVNATSRPAFLALGSELSPRYRGAVLGLLSLTNQGGTALGSGLGGVVIGLAGYPGMAIAMAAGGVLASALAVPLARRRMDAPR